MTRLAIGLSTLVLTSLATLPVDARLAESVESALSTALATDDPAKVDDWPIYRLCLLEHEGIEPLLEELASIIVAAEEELFEAAEGEDKAGEDDSDDNDAASEKEARETDESVSDDTSGESTRAPSPELEAVTKRLRAARWLRARLAWRYGLPKIASLDFGELAESTGHPLALFRNAQILDAGGETTEATEAYKKVLESNPDEDLAERVRLRLAIFNSTGQKIEGLGNLEDFARERTPEFRNRAAVVLALAGKAKEALELYSIDEDESSRFKQEIRIAEWAMAAGDTKSARESAWRALEGAKLKRDRRYALTVLAEAYRRDEILPELIARFESTGEELEAESRATWIDLLRETGQVERALELFRSRDDGDGQLAVETRRALLEICKESEDEEMLVETHRDLIENEPTRVEWRSGLARFYLERGDRPAGLGVWEGFAELASSSQLLEAAIEAEALALTELAMDYAERIVRSETLVIEALHFLFNFHRKRADEDAMVASLERIEELAEPDASERVQLAEAWEQIGRHSRSADVLERLREARGPANFSSDLEMRLAWLYSEVGEEEKAFERWQSVWLRVDSPGRRRYVEDRLMATASRLGKLADIAIDLEEKLEAGQASARDSGLLVRLYTKVGDPVSAAEIIQEYMTRSGGEEIKVLEEKARVYVMCNDYYNYERTLRRLMELDPEGRPEYLTQLAMSCLERGKNDEARTVLTEMRELEENPASAEFEAGVLKIAGLHEEAVRAHWRGVAEHPGRIDAYLLLGRALETVNRGAQSIGIFQYLVENADADDLFTVAIDGLLNARAGRPTMEWAKRVILERLAGRDDKVYLFQLLSDVADEIRDEGLKRRALAETLPIAGERRTSFLRELMELAKSGVGRGFRSSSSSLRNKDVLLSYGRRLVGIGEAVPPQVYLDLGMAFLASKDVRNAAKTFDRADSSADYVGYHQKVASAFESRGYARSALRIYERLVVSSGQDIGLLVKLGEYYEQLGRDADANRAFRRAIDGLLEQQALLSAKSDSLPKNNRYYYSRNVDSFGKYYNRVLTGFLATADAAGDARESFVLEQVEKLDRDLARVAGIEEGQDERTLALCPRINRRVAFLQRNALANGEILGVRMLAGEVLVSFPGDEDSLARIVSDLESWGYRRSAVELVDAAADHLGAKKAREALGLAGDGGDGGLEARARRVFQALLDRDEGAARELLASMLPDELRRADATTRRTLLAAAMSLRDQRTLETIAKIELARSPQYLVSNAIRVVNQCFGVFDEERRRSFTAFVAGLLDARANDIQAYQWYQLDVLNKLLGGKLGLRPAMARSRAQELLAKGGYWLYYLSPLFNALSEEDYSSLLGEAFSKAKRADRLGLLVSLIGGYDREMPASLKELFLELTNEVSFEGQRSNPLYRLTSPYEQRSDVNIEFIGDFVTKLASLQAEEKRLEFEASRVTIFCNANRYDLALAPAKKIYRASLDPTKKDAAQAFARIRRLVLPKYAPELASVIDEAAAEEGADALALTRSKIQLLRQSAVGAEVLIDALRAALESHPEDESLADILVSTLNSAGRRIEAIAVMERFAAKEESKDGKWTKKLVAAWRSLEHPIRAARVLERFSAKTPSAPPAGSGESATSSSAESGARASVPSVAPSGARVAARQVSPAAGAAAATTSTSRGGSSGSTPTTGTTGTGASTATGAAVAPRGAGSTIASAARGLLSGLSSVLKKTSAPNQEQPLASATPLSVKAGIEADKPEEAKTALRRLWRQFQNLDAMSSGRYYSNYRGSNNRFALPAVKAGSSSTPATAKTTEGAAGANARVSRPGGLEGRLAELAGQSGPSGVKAPVPGDVWSELNTNDVIVDEARRWFRTLAPSEYQGFQVERLLLAIVEHRVATRRIDVAAEEIIAAARRPDSGLLDELVAIKLLEMHPEAGGETAGEFLRELVARLDTANTTMTLALARCFARRGDGEMATRLFVWIAAFLRQPVANSGYIPGGRLTHYDVLREARELLVGADRERCIAAVLAINEPHVAPGADSAQHFSHDSLVLSTWAQLLAPREVWSRCPSVCERGAAHASASPEHSFDAARFLAAAGRIEAALDTFEAVVVAPPFTGYRRIFNPTYGGWVYMGGSQKSSRERLTIPRLAKLFPESLDEWAEPAAWLAGAAGRVARWLDAGTLPDGECFRSLALIAYRQSQLGRIDDAIVTLSFLDGRTPFLPDDSLWLADATRLCGDEVSAAAIERALVEKGHLTGSRAGKLIRWTIENRSASESLGLLDALSAYALAGDTVDLALEIAMRLGDREAITRWSETKYELIRTDSRPERYGFAIAHDGRDRLYRHVELGREIVVHDRVGDLEIVVFYDRGQRRAHAFKSSGQTFSWNDTGVIDAEGRSWNLETGTRDAGDEKLEALAIVPALIAPWRKSHPTGSVYLVDALAKVTWIVPRGSDGWRYRDAAGEPPADWRAPGFDDSSWQSGKAPLGYGEDDIMTTVSYGADESSKNASVAFRRLVTVPEGAEIARLVGRIRADDGARISLNGREVHRLNMPSGAITASTEASKKADEGVFAVFMVDPALLEKGPNVIAVSVHQSGLASSDLVLDFELGWLSAAELVAP